MHSFICNALEIKRFVLSWCSTIVHLTFELEYSNSELRPIIMQASNFWHPMWNQVCYDNFSFFPSSEHRYYSPNLYVSNTGAASHSNYRTSTHPLHPYDAVSSLPAYDNMNALQTYRGACSLQPSDGLGSLHQYGSNASMFRADVGGRCGCSPNNCIHGFFDFPFPRRNAESSYQLQSGILREMPKPIQPNIAESYLDVELKLCQDLAHIEFKSPVSHVYSPLEYAIRPHSQFIRRFCTTQKDVLFVGMNPGPFGMAQTGVPFGEISMVREWLKISGSVDKPKLEHPKRRVQGFRCRRSEVSGKRFWSLFQELCGQPENFFRCCFVYNMCPLMFLSEAGKNITPDKLHVAERSALNRICDASLCEIVKLLGSSVIVGVGKYACGRARSALQEHGVGYVHVMDIMHPSPANPQANKAWREIVLKQLSDLGLMMYLQPSHPGA